jgi:integrase
MASIARRPDGRWRAGYRDAAGREHARHFARKADAQAWLDSVTTAVHTGSYVDPDRAKITVGELAPIWLAGKINLKPTTRARYEDVLRTHVGPRWYPLPLFRVEHGVIQAWLAELSSRGLSGASVRKAHGVLAGILGLAVRDRRLPSNPAAGVALPPLNQARRKYLAADQVEALAVAAGPGRVAVLVLAYCGLRWSELAALRVRHIDLMRRRLTIEEAVTEINGGRIVWGTPKSHERRSVPIPRSLVDELAVALVGKDRDDLAFTSPMGGVLRNRNARGLWFDHAATEIGEPGLTPHELRHTAASLAVSAGANVKAVQRMLGHASAAMTLDRYADLFDDDLDAVADRLDAVRGSARGLPADYLRTDAKLINLPTSAERPADPQTRGLQSVETRGIEPLTPALQRRCSAN